MRNMLSVIIALCLISSVLYADVTVSNNGTQVGRVEKINFKGGTTSRSGQQATVDITALNNVNWTTVGPINNANINWTSIPQNIPNVGMNWTDIRELQKNTTGVNWMFLDVNTGGVNWNSVGQAATATNIVCWKANGQLGRCATSVSGVNCTACQ